MKSHELLDASNALIKQASMWKNIVGAATKGVNAVANEGRMAKKLFQEGKAADSVRGGVFHDKGMVRGALDGLKRAVKPYTQGAPYDDFEVMENLHGILPPRSWQDFVGGPHGMDNVKKMVTSLNADRVDAGALRKGIAGSTRQVTEGQMDKVLKGTAVGGGVGGGVALGADQLARHFGGEAAAEKLKQQQAEYDAKPFYTRWLNKRPE